MFRRFVFTASLFALAVSAGDLVAAPPSEHNMAAEAKAVAKEDSAK